MVEGNLVVSQILCLILCSYTGQAISVVNQTPQYILFIFAAFTARVLDKLFPSPTIQEDNSKEEDDKCEPGTSSQRQCTTQGQGKHMKSLFPKGPKSTFHSSEKIDIFQNNHIALYKFT